MNELYAHYYQLEKNFMSALSVHYTQFSTGIDLYISREKNPFFNFIYAHESAEEDALLNAKEYMEDQCHHYLIVADECVGGLLKPAAANLGIKFDAITTAMAMGLDKFIGKDLEADIVIECVNDDLSSWLIPLKGAFNMHNTSLAQQYLSLHQSALAKDSQMYHFVLKKDDVPITALTLTIEKDLARLDDIGTVMSYQGKGYASRMIQYALRFAQSKKVKSCFLEASKEGRGLYEKIGFKPIFNYYSFVY